MCPTAFGWARGVGTLGTPPIPRFSAARLSSWVGGFVVGAIRAGPDAGAPEGAFGVLFQDGLPFALTLEHTYADPRVKIPAGLYDCRSSYFHRGGYDAYEITGVAGHTRLLFHKGQCRG